MQAISTLESLAARIVEAGGATLNPWTFDAADATSGYAVSPFPKREAQYPIAAFSGEELADYAQANSDIWDREPRAMLGAWVDGRTMFLDCSVIVESLDEALRIGKAAGQLAIWDIANKREIRIA